MVWALASYLCNMPSARPNTGDVDDHHFGKRMQAGLYKPACANDRSGQAECVDCVGGLNGGDSTAPVPHPQRLPLECIARIGSHSGKEARAELSVCLPEQPFHGREHARRTEPHRGRSSAESRLSCDVLRLASPCRPEVVQRGLHVAGTRGRITRSFERGIHRALGIRRHELGVWAGKELHPSAGV